jgi:hypothetical protein
MRRAILAAVAAAVLALSACDTDSATDVGQFSATLQGDVRCKPGTYDAHVQFELREVGGEFEPVGPQHPYSCADEAGVEKDVPATTVSDLDHSTEYEYRLRAADDTTWDADGTENGTNYDRFTTQAFPAITPNSTVEAFRNSIGVNTKLPFTGTSYSNFGAVRQALQDTGIRRIREGYHWIGNYENGSEIRNGGLDYQRDVWPTLMADGVRAQMSTVGCVWYADQFPWDDPIVERRGHGGIDQALDDFVARGFDDFAIAWEGPNEPNWSHSACPVGDWAPQTHTWFQRTQASLTEHGLDDLPFVGYSCGGVPCSDQFVAAGGYQDQYGVNLANTHPYRGDDPPENAVEQECPKGLSSLSPSLRQTANCQITEFGWAWWDWTDLGTNLGPSERVQATYTLRAYLDYFEKTGNTSFAHQLADLHVGQEQSHEGSFGLYEADWSPRLVATALKRQKEVIGDGSAPLEPLAYQVTNPGTGFRQYVMRRGDGKYVIATWRAIVTGHQGPAGSAPVQFQIPDATDVQMARPVSSAGSVSIPLGANGTFSVNVSSEPQFFVVSRAA